MTDETSSARSFLAFLFIASCGILKIVRINENANVSRASDSVEHRAPINISPKEIVTKTIPSEIKQPNTIDCSSEKYSDLCYSKEAIFISQETLSVEESERCLGVGLAVKRSLVEADKQSSYLSAKEKSLKKKIEDGEAGRLSEEETQSLIDELNKFDKQIIWINNAFSKARKASESIKKCANLAIHENAIDSRVEEIAIREYNKIWK
jgi:hypothetical protein